MRKQLRLALVALTVVLAVAAQASADCQKKITLSPTAAGAAIGASGTAEVRARGNQQRFKVSIDAEVPDGTTFAVTVFNGGSGPFLAGSITVTLGAGELDLNNNNGNKLPLGVSPTCSITTVQVSKADGTILLEGSF